MRGIVLHRLVPIATVFPRLSPDGDVKIAIQREGDSLCQVAGTVNVDAPMFMEDAKGILIPASHQQKIEMAVRQVMQNIIDQSGVPDFMDTFLEP